MKHKTIEWDGSQITKPGMYSNIPLNLYHAADICNGPSISSTGLRDIFLRSAKHFYARWSGNPKRKEDDKEKRAFVVGRALHHLVLGQPYFAKLFVIEPDEWPDERGELKKWHNGRSICKKWQREQRKAGRTVLTQKEAEQVKQMAIALGNYPLVHNGVLNGYVERSFFWKDRETGIWLKWRPDNVPLDSADFVDLKKTRDIFHGHLMDAIFRYGYFMQAALGFDACREVLKMRMESFRFIFAEDHEPWHVTDYDLPQEDLHRGARCNRAAIRTFARCLETNTWPGPNDGNEANSTLAMSNRGREIIDKRLSYEGLADGED